LQRDGEFHDGIEKWLTKSISILKRLANWQPCICANGKNLDRLALPLAVGAGLVLEVVNKSKAFG
jgi:hypothetical protein